MFWIVIHLIDLIIYHKVTLLIIVWFLSMIDYGVFIYYFKKYKPYKRSYRIPISIVIPVFKEKPELFEKCLKSVKNQLNKYDELLIIFDGEDKQLQKIGSRYGITMTKIHSGKRGTLSYGCNKSQNSIILTMDSDTVLCPNCINEILKPFVNKKIGAVSAYQRIFDADNSYTCKFADYNELISHGFLQKATSAAGNVPVLYGRCLAIRKEVWSKITDEYQNKKFLGRKVESGDDNDITVLTIKQGYNTFMQSTARVHSDCPRNFFKRLYQQ